MAQTSFRNRIHLALILLGVLPTSVVIVALVISLRSSNAPAAVSAALTPVAATGREMLQVIDTTDLSLAERRALRDHADSLNRALGRASAALAFNRRLTPTLTAVVLLGGGLLLYFTWYLGLSLSRQLSSPIEELIGWTDRIRHQEPLPQTHRAPGAPEFTALREALREMAAALQQARSAELEAERLRAFREVARRVAHEMKNPLTPVRFAISQLERTASPEQRESLEVLSMETARLDLLAKDFSNLGRLPEGPSAEVDVGELLGEILRTTLPPGMTHTLEVDPHTPLLVGHYDPLHRAFTNLIRNAVEASGGEGRLDASVRMEEGEMLVRIADHGGGIPEALREKIFMPYVTDKPDGTGLGLSIVKQAIDLHNGTISVEDTPGGGATFVVRFHGRADRSRRLPYLGAGLGRRGGGAGHGTEVTRDGRTDLARRTGEYRFPQPAPSSTTSSDHE